MAKPALALLALVMLGGCASIAPLGMHAGAHMSFDSMDAAPVERWAPVGAETLDRRLFAAPDWRRPNERPFAATALDRRMRRHRHRRRGAIPSALLTS